MSHRTADPARTARAGERQPSPATPSYLEALSRAGMTRKGRAAAREELRRRERVTAAAIRRATGKSLTLVKLHRPWWMPGPLYRALLRSVTVEDRAL